MRLSPSRPMLAITLIGVAALVSAGCGGTIGASDFEPVDISGSSTVAPITTRVAELWSDSGSKEVVNIDGPGTGDGFVLFCDGEVSIVDASRPITESEAEACADHGIEFIELKVAFDGISILTNPANEAVDCLSFADLYALVGPESKGFSEWSDGQELAKELRSRTRLPRLPLDLSGPGEESGTYDSFVEQVISPVARKRAGTGDISDKEVGQTRPDYQSASDDNVIIQSIQGSTSSLGWVGFAFAEEAGDSVKELAISAGTDGTCVMPSEESIANGTYPISRPLFIYVNATDARTNPAVAEFVDFYLSDEGLATVPTVGYVSLPAPEVEATRAIWKDRTTGVHVGT